MMYVPAIMIPTDYPEGFVARMHVVGPSPAKSGATANAFFGPTLDSVRAQLPAGLVHMGRDARDDAKIVESWI